MHATLRQNIGVVSSAVLKVINLSRSFGICDWFMIRPLTAKKAKAGGLLVDPDHVVVHFEEAETLLARLSFSKTTKAALACTCPFIQIKCWSSTKLAFLLQLLLVCLQR